MAIHHSNSASVMVSLLMLIHIHPISLLAIIITYYHRLHHCACSL